MAMSWFAKEKEEKEDTGIEIKVPKAVEDKLSKIDVLETSMNEFKEKSKVLDDMGAFLREQKEAKEAARAKAAAEAAKTANEKTKEEIEEQWLTDPRKAFEMEAAPLKAAQINLASQNMRREIFDDGKEFEYYHGEFKKEVDSLIDNNLNLASRADPQSIKNCYYLVLGKKAQEIREGKLKSKFTATSNTNANASDGSKSGSGEIVLTDSQKRAADRLGVKHEDYAKQTRELNYV